MLTDGGIVDDKNDYTSLNINFKRILKENNKLYNERKKNFIVCVIFAFISIIFICISFILHFRNQNVLFGINDLILTSDSIKGSAENNMLYTGFEKLNITVVSLPKRVEEYFKPLQRDLKAYGLECEMAKGVNGHKLNYEINNYDGYKIDPAMIKILKENDIRAPLGLDDRNLRGTMGCALAHLGALDQDFVGMRHYLEDDVILCNDYRNRLQLLITNVTKFDPNWELLATGFSCEYKSFYHCTFNDGNPIHEGGFMKINAFVGSWGYIVRSSAVAKKIFKYCHPVTGSIDIIMSRMVTQGKLKAYGAIPHLTIHPGQTRISSIDLSTYGSTLKKRSDTNDSN